MKLTSGVLCLDKDVAALLKPVVFFVGVGCNKVTLGKSCGY